MTKEIKEMKTLELVQVSPLQGSSAQFYLPLSFLDLIWLKFPPIKRVFFYREMDLSPSRFHSVLLPRLKLSLSLTLIHYLPIAGRLVWEETHPKPHIVCSEGDAVAVKVAESEADMGLLSGDQPRQATLLRMLVPLLEASENSSPIFAIQLTFFPNQGFCIGIASHHSVFDGKSTTMFMKAWAYVCRTEKSSPTALPEEFTPFMDRTVLVDSGGFEAGYLNAWMSIDPRRSLRLLPDPDPKPEMQRATFRLTRDDINHLRNLIKKESRHPDQLRLSTFVLSFAYVLTSLVRARGGDTDRVVGIGFAADYRSRFEPPIPSTYLGNCVGGAGNFDSISGTFAGDGGYLAAVEKVSGMVSGLNVEALAKITQFMESIWKANPWTQLITVSGSNHFNVYETDFGWGRLAKVEVVSIDSNQAISIAENQCQDDGGIEVGVCLEEKELHRFTLLFNHGLKLLNQD